MSTWRGASAQFGAVSWIAMTEPESLAMPSADSSVGWRLQLSRSALATGPDGRAHELPWRDAALLAWLAIEGATPRARLAALLWPDSSPESARNSLRQRLFQLRKLCGVELVGGSSSLALAAAVTHDLDDSDTVLGEHRSEVGGEFAQWLEQQRVRRRDRVGSSLIELAEMAEAAKDWDDARMHAKELLALDPLSESAHRRMMRLHYLAGDRAAALLAFDGLERLLKDEVGARPSPETLALLATIEQAQPSRALAVAHGRVPASMLRPPRLVGREREWALLHQAWAAQRAVAVVGEAGMGKSRLVGDFAQAQGRTLLAGARPGDARVVYASLSRLLRLLPREAMNVLAEGVRHELARLLPELGDGSGVPGGDDRTRLFNAVLAALDSPALEVDAFVVDDLHFADDASIELLRYVAAGSQRRWWIAARGSDLSAAGRAWLDDLGADSQSLALELPALTAPQIAELLDTLEIDGIDARSLAPELLRHTGGNPLLVLETLRAWVTQGGVMAADSGGQRLPATRNVSALVERRIARLSVPALRLARCAAVAGQDFSAALAAGVLAVPALDLADAWTELEQALVLREGAFAHDLIYEATLASVPAPIARELHLQIARVLDSNGGQPSRIAAHWLAGGAALRAVPFLQAAARQAMQAFRYAEADQGHAQAAQILEQSGQPRAAFAAWYDAADALSSIGGYARLRQHVERLDALAESDEELAKAAVVRAALDCEAGHFDAALQVAERGLEPARRAGLAEQQSDLLYILGVIHWDRRQVSQAIARTEQALALRRSLPPASLRPDDMNAQITMVQALGSMLGAAGRFIEAHDHVREAYRLSVEHARPHNMLGAASDLCLRCTELGDGPGALQWVERGQQACATHGTNAGDRIRFEINCAGVLVVAGHWAAALQQYDEVAHDVAEGPDRRRPDVAARRAAFLALIGRRDLGWQALRDPAVRAQATVAQQLLLDTAALELDQKVDVGALLEQVVATEDVGLRARFLIRLAHHGEAKQLLPVLGIAATTMRDGGQLGQWLALQGRRAALLATLGRHADAAQCAQAAWRQFEGGTTPSTFEADFCLDLAQGFADTDPQHAARALERARVRFAAAAATLDSPWREVCLQRSPLQQRLAALGAHLAQRDAALPPPVRRAARKTARKTPGRKSGRDPRA